MSVKDTEKEVNVLYLREIHQLEDKRNVSFLQMSSPGLPPGHSKGLDTQGEKNDSNVNLTHLAMP